MPLWTNTSTSTRHPRLRIALRLLVLSAGAVLGTICVHRVVLPVVGWLCPPLQPLFYDLAVYGPYPTEDYLTFPLKGPRSSNIRWTNACDNGHVFLSPYGASARSGGPMILDSRGRLIWTTDRFREYGTVMNLRMQKWQGRNYLTFWAGEKFGFAGKGAYYMLDSSYNLVKIVQAVGSAGDLHEFEITQDGTALLTLYEKKQTDLRQMGMGRSENGWIFESAFQEIDLQTGALIFEWNASGHFTVESSSHAHPLAGYSEWLPFDFFHINSVQKDQYGNYMVSSRHLGAIIYINGSSGATEWVLGGGDDLNSFEDASSGKTTGFSWQHDARWASRTDGDEERIRILSLFDNASAGPFQFNRVGKESKGRLIRLDLGNMTATLIQSYPGWEPITAASQGSMQILNQQHAEPDVLDDDKHVFTGWGSAAAYTEHALNGTLLCETHFAAKSSWWWERVKSYRAFKVLDWIGTPTEPPVALVSGDEVLVSWNGATEARFWELWIRVDGEQVESGWQNLSTHPRTQFETALPLPQYVTRRQQRYELVVGALDESKEVLRYSNHITIEPALSVWSMPGVGVCLVLAPASLIGIWFARRAWARRRYARRFGSLLQRGSGRSQ